ncbi:MAG: hypothetical protein C5B50_10480 [Verrucomicrobia bacterium]|nr:MAG: hypothetical protein C5B50_10480 [Verrucomicrobiota bacterium]
MLYTNFFSTSLQKGIRVLKIRYMIKPPEMSRRRFIQSTAAMALSASVLGLESPILASSSKKWPVGCRDLHLKTAGKPDSWSCMNALGAECTEVDVAQNMTCVHLFHPNGKYVLASQDGIKRLKDDVGAASCRISAFMMSNELDKDLDKELEWTRRLVKVAVDLGVNAIRIDVVPRTIKGKDEFVAFAIKACKQLCQIAEGTPVRFGVENHSTLMNDPVLLQRLFDGVGSEKLGMTLDCANFYWWGHPLNHLYSLYEQFAPRVIHTHCKNIHYPEDKRNIKREMGWEYSKYNCPLYEGDIDFKRITSILRKANYAGDLCVEDESLGKFPEAERGDVVRKEIAALKALA